MTQVKNTIFICKLIFVLDIGSVGYGLNPLTLLSEFEPPQAHVIVFFSFDIKSLFVLIGLNV